MADETVAVNFVFGHVADLFLAVAEVFLLYKAIQAWSQFMTQINEYKEYLECNPTLIPKFPQPVVIDMEIYCRLKEPYIYGGWTFTPICRTIYGKEGPIDDIKGWTASNGKGCSIELGPEGGGRFALQFS